MIIRLLSLTKILILAMILSLRCLSCFKQTGMESTDNRTLRENIFGKFIVFTDKICIFALYLRGLFYELPPVLYNLLIYSRLRFKLLWFLFFIIEIAKVYL